MTEGEITRGQEKAARIRMALEHKEPDTHLSLLNAVDHRGLTQVKRIGSVHPVSAPPADSRIRRQSSGLELWRAQLTGRMNIPPVLPGWTDHE